MNQSKEAQDQIEDKPVIDGVLTQRSLEQLQAWLSSYGILMNQDALARILQDEEDRVRLTNKIGGTTKDIKVVNSRVQLLLNFMRKNTLQRKSQEMLLSTYEFTNLQQEESLKTFQLRQVLDVETDFSQQSQRNLEDIARLCQDHEIAPYTNSADLSELLDEKVKNIVFESGYLNEKVEKRNHKLKSVMHPELQRKQILAEVLENTWELQAKGQKQEMDKITQKTEQEEKKVEDMNDIERAKLNDLKKDNEQVQKFDLSEEQKQQIKSLNLTLMEQKSHEVKYLELTIKQMREKIIGDYSSLPPDLAQAKKRLFELENLVKNMNSTVE